MVAMHGVDKLLSFKGEMRIPLAHVKSAKLDPEASKAHFVGVKLGGINIPGMIRIGTYEGRDGLAFWDIRKPEEALVIELHDETYARLFLQVDNVEAVAAEIQKALPPA